MPSEPDSRGLRTGFSRALPFYWDLYARLVYRDGTYRARQDVYTGPHDQLSPAMAFNSSNREYLVVWQSDHGC